MGDLSWWFQGLDAPPGLKGEKGIVGFPGLRVSKPPSLHYLMINVSVRSVDEMSCHHLVMSKLKFNSFHVNLQCINLFQGLPGYNGQPGKKGAKVRQTDKNVLYIIERRLIFLLTQILLFHFQEARGSPGLPGLIGREGQKVSIYT